MTVNLASSPYIAGIVGFFGDVNFTDHGGGFVFIHDQTGEPEWEHVEPPCADDWDCPECCGCSRSCGDEGCEHDTCDGGGDFSCIKCKGTGKNPDLRWTVYSGLLEKPDWVEWDDVARTCGQDPDDYAKAWQGGDPMPRMGTIEDAAGHYGWHEFDSYPLSLTFEEVTERYRDIHSLARKA